MNQELDLLEALEHIDPAGLSYQEWLSVGMGLKEAGHPASAWEDWSRRDPARYHPGECERKWKSFKGSADPVTAGTIVQMARSRGWQTARGVSGAPEQHGQGPIVGHGFGWDDMIGLYEKGAPMGVVDRAWLENREVEEPEEWDPASQLIRYLKLLFNKDEYVGYVTRSFEKDGRRMPTKGCWDRTAGALIERLQSCGGDLGGVLGDYDPETGAWIRFNPLDGNGVKDSNVTAFRFALIESDNMELGEQNALIRELELPVACLVYSGGRSLHAIVHIDASSYEEYRRRVDYLHAVCKKNGLETDTSARNPSRLSRMPGAVRGGRKQFIVDANIGKASWDEWREWMESVSDDLPDPENMAGVWDKLPALAPPLIDGVLRQGHKLLLAGPSKAGKSYALIELCCSIAEGLP